MLVEAILSSLKIGLFVTLIIWILFCEVEGIYSPGCSKMIDLTSFLELLAKGLKLIYTSGLQTIMSQNNLAFFNGALLFISMAQDIVLYIIPKAQMLKTIIGAIFIV